MIRSINARMYICTAVLHIRKSSRARHGSLHTYIQGRVAIHALCSKVVFQDSPVLISEVSSAWYTVRQHASVGSHVAFGVFEETSKYTCVWISPARMPSGVGVCRVCFNSRSLYMPVCLLDMHVSQWWIFV